MKKIVTTIIILLLLSTTTQAQTRSVENYDYERNSVYSSTYSSDYSIACDNNRPKVIKLEQGQEVKLTIMDTIMVKHFVYHPSNSNNSKKIKYLTWNELNQEQKDEYRRTITKQRNRNYFVRDSIEKADQNNKFVARIAEQQRIKKFEEDSKHKKDSLNLVEKNKNVNGWSNKDFADNYYKMSPKNLVVVERHVKVGGYLQTTLDKKYACLLLPISDRNISYIDCDVNNLVSFNEIKPIDIIEILNYGENGTVLLRNKKTAQLYIGDYNVIFHQHDMFDVNSVLFSKVVEKEESKVLSVEEVAIQNRYKNILTTYKTKLARINAICDKKAYEVRYTNGSVAYDTRRFSKLDKKEYNELDLWFEKANQTLWVEIREDETILNGNNDIMEKLLENDKWLNLKVGLEQSQSIEHIYN
nr:hypothetical protein [uncultured Flavobacterium sp.]